MVGAHLVSSLNHLIFVVLSVSFAFAYAKESTTLDLYIPSKRCLEDQLLQIIESSTCFLLHGDKQVCREIACVFSTANQPTPWAETTMSR